MNCNSSVSSSYDDGKVVRFHAVNIIEIGMVLGDNPAVSSGGPPVQLGTKEVSNVTREINLHELTKADSRLSDELRIMPHQRTNLLLHAGYTMNEICDATLEVQKVQKLRHESLQHQQLGSFGRFTSNLRDAVGTIKPMKGAAGRMMSGIIRRSGGSSSNSNGSPTLSRKKSTPVAPSA